MAIALACLFSGAALLGVSPLRARQIEDWPFDKLFKHADLVIAKAVSTADAGPEVKDKVPADYLKAVLTTCCATSTGWSRWPTWGWPGSTTPSAARRMRPAP